MKLTLRSCLLAIVFNTVALAEPATWTHSVKDSTGTDINAEFFQDKLVTLVYFIDQSFNAKNKEFEKVAKGLARSLPTVHSVFVIRVNPAEVSEEDFPSYVDEWASPAIRNMSLYLRTQFLKSTKAVGDQKGLQASKAEPSNLVELGVESLRKSLHFVNDGEQAISSSFGIADLSYDVPYALLVIDSEARVVSSNGKSKK